MCHARFAAGWPLSRRYSNHPQEARLIQAAHQCAHANFGFRPRGTHGCEVGKPLVWQEAVRRRALKPRQPDPLRAVQVRQGVAHGSKAAAEIARELVETEWIDGREHAVPCPVVIVDGVPGVPAGSWSKMDDPTETPRCHRPHRESAPSLRAARVALTSIEWSRSASTVAVGTARRKIWYRRSPSTPVSGPS